MTKKELIRHWEEELTFTQEQVKNNIKNNELTTALKHQLHEKSILMFIESLKQLSEETRKDFEKDKIKVTTLTKDEVENNRSKANDYLL